MVESQCQQIKSLESQKIRYLQSQPCQNCTGGSLSASTSNNPGPSTSMAFDLLNPPTNPAENISLPPGRKHLKFTFARYCDIKEAGCRVGAYNEGMNLLVVSHEMKTRLFPSKCILYGICGDV